MTRNKDLPQKDIGDVFRSNFESFEPETKTDLWPKISATISKPKLRLPHFEFNKLHLNSWFIGVGFVVIGFLFYLYIKQSNDVPLQVQKKSKGIVKSNTTELYDNTITSVESSTQVKKSDFSKKSSVQNTTNQKNIEPQNDHKSEFIENKDTTTIKTEQNPTFIINTDSIHQYEPKFKTEANAEKNKKTLFDDLKGAIKDTSREIFSKPR